MPIVTDTPDDLDSWKQYLNVLEKGDYALWRAVDSFSSFTTFVFSGAFILAGLPLLFHYASGLLSGIEEPRTGMTRAAARIFLPVAVALAISIVVNLYAWRRADRMEALGRTRKREHDEVVHVTRQVVRAARLVAPVRANMP